MRNPAPISEHDDVQTAAAEWLIRLRQPDVSAEEVTEWQRWLRRDERHAAAFEGMESLWDGFERIPAPPAESPRALAADRYDGGAPVGEFLASSRPRRAYRGWAVAAGVALVCAAVAGVTQHRATARHDELAWQVIETAVGENRSITLADGSSVQLGGHSRLSFSLRTDLRDLVLEAGEAFFKVAKDPARPFRVHAGNATVTAVGTEFDVHRSDDRVTVAVIEGRVMVQPMAPLVPVSWLPPSEPVGLAAPLNAGERTIVNRRGVESTSVGGTTAALGWQDGRLAFEGESLRYVVQDVNRYSPKTIVIADSRTGELRVTGTITHGNVLGWVSSLKAALNVRADVQPDRIVLYRE